VTIHSEWLSQFRLLIQLPTDDVERRRDASALTEVPIALGVSTLDLETFASDPRLSSDRRGGTRSTRALHFEPLSVGGRPSLLMLTPPLAEVRLNDRPAPRVAVLDVGDQLQIGQTVLHLTRYRQFEVGPPSPEQLGRRCGVCRVPFDESTKIYVHDCGEAMHMEDGSRPAGDRLECAALGACPKCERPVSFQSGYLYTPEL
jgi:hypothetical protein